MSPSFLPEETSDSSPSSAKESILGLPNADCPSGTIPVRRTTQKDLIRTKSYNGANAAQIHPTVANFPGSLTVAMQMVNQSCVFYSSVSGKFSIWNFMVEERQSSTVQLWVEAGSSEQLNSLQVGWIISPQVYGDSSTRLFIYCTADGYRKTGCYDLRCAGFVQVHKGALIGGKQTQVSTLNGTIYQYGRKISQDPKTKNWWLYSTLGNVPIRYWPAQLFHSLASGARQVSWGTENPDGTFPPMGSSPFSEPHNCQTSSYFSQMEYSDGSSRHVPGTDNTKQIVHGSCYSFKILRE